MSVHESQARATPPQSRLPCRGCTTDCKNYAVCEGTPWRIERDGKVPHETTGTGRG